jgi:hypothetical protein
MPRLTFSTAGPSRHPLTLAATALAVGGLLVVAADARATDGDIESLPGAPCEGKPDGSLKDLKYPSGYVTEKDKDGHSWRCIDGKWCPVSAAPRTTGVIAPPAGAVIAPPPTP